MRAFVSPSEGIFSTASRIAQYDEYLDRGVPVFSVDYSLPEKNAMQVYRDARRLGMRPLVTQVPLSQITNTPPGDF